MIRYCVFFVVCFWLSFGGPSQACAVLDSRIGEIDTEQLKESVDAIIDKQIAAKRIVGLVVIVGESHRVIYSRAAGFADREAQKPMQLDSIFRLSSVTKIYTTMAAAALLRQNKLSWDDPVTKWLPYFTPRMKDGSQPTITIRHLLNHTAGLDYRFTQPKGGSYHVAGVSDGMDISHLTLEENLRRIASVPLLYEPGTSWAYSVATDVLGAVIEKAHGTDLPTAIRDLVTSPLGLRDSTFVVSDKKRLVTQYRKGKPEPVRMEADTYVPLGKGRHIHFSPGRILRNDQFPSGGTGMAATATDIFKLLQTVQNAGHPIASIRELDKMKSVQPIDIHVSPGLSYGMGWALLLDPVAAKSPQAVCTISWGGVYGLSWFVDPTGLIVVIATNTALEGLSGPIVNQIRDAVYNAKDHTGTKLIKLQK